MNKPKKWKMMLLSWITIYPLINIIFFTLMPHITDWHPMLKTLLITLILVPLMGIISGILQEKLKNWIIK